MVLAQSPGAALNKVFACNKRCGRKSGFMSKVGCAALIRGAATNREFTVLSFVTFNLIYNIYGLTGIGASFSLKTQILQQECHQADMGYRKSHEVCRLLI